MKRKLWLAVASALVLGLLALAFRPRPVDVDLAPVVRGSLRVTVDEDGKTRIKERYVVSSPLAGRLLRIDLEPGDAVTRGSSLLAVLEPRDPTLLDARELASAQARVRAQEAALDRARAEVERTRASMEFSESDLARARQAAERNVISKEELERAVLFDRQSQESFRAARFAEDMARYELELAQAALLVAQGKEAENTQDSHFEIYSPINGRVLRVFQESTTVVNAGAELLEVGDPTDLEVEVDVLSSDAVKIRPNARVVLEQWGGSEPLEGKVLLVEPSAFTKISALGVEEQRVNVIIELVTPPEDRGSLGDAFRVEARIVIWEGEQILKVPTSALFRAGQEWTVFVTNGKRVLLRPVDIGQRNDLEAEVLSGLSEGDRVVVHPSDKLQDGVRIEERQLE
jgi:HlyD family secretion protein